METGLLHLHNVLRWVILLLLLVTLFHAFAKKQAITKSSLWLLIFSHIMLVIGLYQVIAGRYGITKPRPEGVGIENPLYRFYWIEHPSMMIIAIVLITIARGKAKVLNYKATGWLLLIALLLILAAIPWPFREEAIRRGLFPGMPA